MNKDQWATNLLRDDYFIEMMETLRGIEHAKFATSAPDESNVREQAYYRPGQIEGVDFSISPFRLGRSLFNRIAGILGPYIDTESMVG